MFMNSIKIGDELFEGRSMADAYLVKYNADGTVKWTRHVGKGERYTSILDMTLDSEENIYLAGRFANKSAQVDLVLKFNPEGEQTQRFSVARNVDTFYMGGIAGSAIKISNKDQAIILAGHFRQEVAFGSTLLDSQRGENEYDVFLTKINANGEIAGAIQSTGDGTSSAMQLALTPTDNFYLAGHTVSSIFRFPNQLATKPAANWDIFLYKEHIKALETVKESQPDPGEEEEEPESIEYPQVIIPNIFTPNGDAKNQFFEIVHLDLSQNNSLLIFNRWGKQVYQTKSYQNNWEAAGLADGTYYYVLYLERENKYIKGWVDVVR
jgi:gliding motility-associated-like protein